MIKIKKGDPPPFLLAKQREAREKGLNPDKSYGLLNHSEKEEIKEKLLKEQGYLCAYCMRRIPDERKPTDNQPYDPVTIEHWIPRNPEDKRDVGQGLDYNNLLAVCTGNQGSGTKKKRLYNTFTCGAKRGHKELKINPCDPSTLNGIQYSKEGKISSTDTKIDENLTARLNLNCQIDVLDIPKLRKSALDRFLKKLKTPSEPKELRIYCSNILDSLEGETGKKIPYVGIIIWKLKEIIKGIKE